MCIDLTFPLIVCSEMTGVSSTCDTDIPLVFIDTAGLGVNELDTPDEESKGNEGQNLLAGEIRLGETLRSNVRIFN